ncbi:MAG: O-antigen ligase family protein [Candidatus Latescibacteria bacterium]|nr:O-antigen ligase family protein [Candidatus Latescibacterota bacterium]
MLMLRYILHPVESWNESLSELDRGGLSIKKLLFILVVFELVTMAVFLYGDKIAWAYFAGILLTPVFLLCIPIEPVVGILVMIFTTGIDFIGVITETSEDAVFKLTYFHLATVLTTVSIFLNLLLKGKLNIPNISLWPPVLASIVIIAISTIYSPVFDAGFLELARTLFMVMITLMILIIINKKWRAQIVIWTLIVIPFAISIVSIYQLLNEGSILTPIVRKVATEIGMPVFRSSGTFSNPNALGCFLMVGIVIAVSLMFIEKQSILAKLILMVSIAVSGIGLLITFSRGSWLSTAAGIFFIVLLHRKWSYITYFSIVIIALVVVLAITQPVVVDAVLSRFTTIFDPASDSSSSSRLSLIKSGIWMWQDHPFLGVGAGGFSYYCYDYMDPNMPYQMKWIKEAHTIQAKILAEQGIIGITVASWLFITVLFHGLFSITKIKDTFFKNVQIGFASLFIGFIVNFTFGSDQFNNMFWMITGLIYSIPLVDSFHSQNDVGEINQSE